MTQAFCTARERVVEHVVVQSFVALLTQEMLEYTSAVVEMLDIADCPVLDRDVLGGQLIDREDTTRMLVEHLLGKLYRIVRAWQSRRSINRNSIAIIL